jgi:hypothetical protein
MKAGMGTGRNVASLKKSTVATARIFHPGPFFSYTERIGQLLEMIPENL